MEIITITNDKGGVGKTTLTMLYGEWLARNGKRTLLLDLDPQANLSRRFIDMEIVVGAKDVWRPPIHPSHEAFKKDDPTWDGRSSTSDIWLRGVFYEYPTALPLLKILPAASGTLGDMEHRPRDQIFKEIIEFFVSMMIESGLEKDFDAVLIDTRPSKGPLTTAAMQSSDWIIIPALMQAPSVEGLIGVLNLRNDVNLIRHEKNHLKIAGIVPNQIGRNALHESHLKTMRENPFIGRYIRPEHLGLRIAITRSMEVGAPSIFDLPDSDKARQEVAALCEGLTKTIFGESNS